MDTSVDSGVGRVSNIGLMQTQTNTILVGIASTVTGIGLFVTALLKATSASGGQCPHCGNGVKQGFPKCASCRSDITWVSGRPCIPGQEQELKVSLKKEKEQELINVSKGDVNGAYFIIAVIAVFMILILSSVVLSDASPSQKLFTALIVATPCMGLIFGYIFRIRAREAKIRELTGDNRKSTKVPLPFNTESDPKGTPTDNTPPKLPVPPKIKSDRELDTKENDAKKAFQHALSTLAAGNVEAACKELKLISIQFSSTRIGLQANELYKKELEASNAFSQGKALYLEKSFDQAILILQSLAQQHPDTQGGIQATKILGLEREALLMYNKAVRLNKGGNSNATIDALKELVLKFPQTRHGEKARIAIEKTKK